MSGRGRPPLNLSKSDIEYANENTKSCKRAANWLGVSYESYKKYAKMYGLYEEQKNKPGKGISKPKKLYEGDKNLEAITNGEHPDFDNADLKKRLINAGWKKEECELCGFNESRVTDDKVPLVLQHENGDFTDHNWENLTMVCFNCSFLHYGTIPKRWEELNY